MPLFVEPAGMNPEDYISFREEVPYAVNGSAIGKTTIEALALDREALNEMRRDRLSKLKTLYRIANLQPPIAESAEARQLLEQAIQDRAEYAAMARAATASGFPME